MFIRKKQNRTGSISVSIVEKRKGKLRYLQTIGHATNKQELQQLEITALEQMLRLKRAEEIPFSYSEDQSHITQLQKSISSVRNDVSVHVLENIFHTIGFGAIQDKLFRHLVIMRVLYPVSKLKTIDYLYHHYQISYDLDYVYRYMDKLLNYQEQLQQISYEHTKKIMGGNPSIVLYDVTTLYFEAAQEDELRKAGFSKDGKHQHPQIVLGLLVTTQGYPLAYDMFEGNTFEGETMVPILNSFKKRFGLEQLIVVADAGLLSNQNIALLIEHQYEFILAARIKNESHTIEQKILSHPRTDGKAIVIDKGEKLKLIVSYAKTRAKKDLYNRQRGLHKLENSLKAGKLTKAHLNKKGYNKYLELKGSVQIRIDYDKFNQDQKWDGLKGYLTNTQLTAEEVIKQYKELWHIEKAFRISKTDIRVRPIFHHLARRIRSHLNICFCSYKIYKELERQLQQKKTGLSPAKAIDILKSVYTVETILPISRKKKQLLIVKNQVQKDTLAALNIRY